MGLLNGREEKEKHLKTPFQGQIPPLDNHKIFSEVLNNQNHVIRYVIKFLYSVKRKQPVPQKKLTHLWMMWYLCK